ncbi:MAG: hypothetical protein RLZZ21_2292 [Planctomycetota bacterium]|jgi:hypothetical protein
MASTKPEGYPITSSVKPEAQAEWSAVIPT